MLITGKNLEKMEILAISFEDTLKIAIKKDNKATKNHVDDRWLIDNDPELENLKNFLNKIKSIFKINDEPMETTKAQIQTLSASPLEDRLPRIERIFNLFAEPCDNLNE